MATTSRRQPRRRWTSAARLSMCFLGAAALATGCGGSHARGGSAHPATSGASVSTGRLTGITVTGPLGQAPTISIAAALSQRGTAPSHLAYHDVVVGRGADATDTSTVRVQYVAANYQNGKVFDSSWAAGRKPSTFVMDRLLPGLQLGIAGMRVGGRREIAIPPALAYGKVAQGPIKANETLLFVVDLLAVTPGPTAVAAPIGGSVTGPLGEPPTVVLPAKPPPSVVTYRDIEIGQGPMVSSTATAEVQFIGLNYANARQFDSSWSDAGAEPQTFDLPQIAPGLQAGITGMRVGGRREIIVPPAYAYGSKGFETVGPNETLVYVVDVLALG